MIGRFCREVCVRDANAIRATAFISRSSSSEQHPLLSSALFTSTHGKNMSFQHSPMTGSSVVKIFCLLTASQLILLGTTVAQCPQGSAMEAVCTSCSRLPKAKHFSDYCCSQPSAHDFCANCLKDLMPCLRELTNLLRRRALIMKEDDDKNLDGSDTNKRAAAAAEVNDELMPYQKRRIYRTLFAKRVPEILVPAPPVDEQKRQADTIASI